MQPNELDAAGTRKLPRCCTGHFVAPFFVTLLRSVRSGTIRRDRRRDAREFNDFNWSAFNQSTNARERRGRKISFCYNHESFMPREGSLVGSLFSDACRSIRTCRLCGLRGHRLRVEVTCNSRPIYRLLIPRNGDRPLGCMPRCTCVICCLILFHCDSDASSRHEFCGCVSRAYRISRTNECDGM